MQIRNTSIPRHTVLVLFLAFATITTALGQATPQEKPNYPTPVEGDYKVKNFEFVSKETLPELSLDRKSTRLNSSHQIISYAVFCLKKKKDVKPLWQAGQA